LLKFNSHFDLCVHYKGITTLQASVLGAVQYQSHAQITIVKMLVMNLSM